MNQVLCKYIKTKQKQPPEVFYKKGVLRNFVKFTGKHLCQSLFFNKVAGRMSATLSKKRLWHSCFPENFTKFLRIPFFAEHLRATASDQTILRCVVEDLLLLMRIRTQKICILYRTHRRHLQKTPVEDLLLLQRIRTQKICILYRTHCRHLHTFLQIHTISYIQII